MTPFLTLLIPAYNEGPRLSAAIRSAAQYLSGQPYSWELLVVDDGSQDDTPDRLREESGRLPSLRWVRHPVNSGKGAAVRTGLREARGENILFCDADGATSFGEIGKMLPALKSKPALVCGSRTLRDSRVRIRQAFFRRFLSGGYRWLCRTLVTPGISDITCGFKLVPRSSLPLLIPRLRVNGWSFDAEIFAILQDNRLPIVQVPIEWADQGKSKVRLRRDVLRSFTELLGIARRRWTGSYRRKNPAKIAAVFCVYNEEEYVTYAVRAILPAVERVFILLGEVPYDAYNPRAREVSRADRTPERLKELAGEPKVKIVRGTWSSEVEHRNAGLALCLEEGMDYYWLVDGDEVYRPDHLQRIRQMIEAHPEVGTFIIKCHIFWRSFLYRIPAQEMSWRPRRIFKITRHRRILGLRLPHRCRFVGQNEMNSLGLVFEFPPEEAVFYHFSYARSGPAMEDKFRTFSHAHEIPPQWVENVWKRWPDDREMRDIHPVDPPKFPRAARTPLDDLPPILRSHPYYHQEIIG